MAIAAAGNLLWVAMACTGLLVIRLFSQALRPVRQEHGREDAAVPFKR
jgi:hypothetical protein